MMKKYLLLCLIVIVPILCTSQNTSQITITSEQLQTTNLIFAEHAKFRHEIPLLREQIFNLEKIDSLWQRTDSIRLENIAELNKTIAKKDKKLKTKSTISKIQSIIIGGLVIVCIIL